MAAPYTYQIDRYVDGVWRSEVVAEDQSVTERSEREIARGILEDWVIDHPAAVVGGGRVTAYEGGPHTEDAEVRVLIYSGVGGARDDTVAASAYLLSDPDRDDPHSWVNF